MGAVFAVCYIIIICITGCIDWIHATFPRENGGRRRLLVWDSCQVHLTDAVQQELHRRDIDVAVIPGGLTPLVQPLDVSINRPFKQKMRHSWENWMIEGDPSLTPTGHRRAPTKEMLVSWLVDAWNAIPSAMIEHSFKKCGISCNLDGTEDDIIFDDVCPANETGMLSLLCTHDYGFKTIVDTGNVFVLSTLGHPTLLFYCGN